MKTKGIVKLGLLVALTGGMSATSSWAGEPVALLISGNQDALVLGTVMAVTPEAVQFQPTVVIPGQRGEMLVENGQPIAIRYTSSGSHYMYQSPLAVGNRALVSLQSEGKQYGLSHGAFQVSSFDLATLKVANVEKASDLIMLQWYLNSCGQDSRFSRHGSTVMVESGGGILPIGVKVANTWVELSHPPSRCGQNGMMYWWGSWIWFAGILLAIGILGGTVWRFGRAKVKS